VERGGKFKPGVVWNQITDPLASVDFDTPSWRNRQHWRPMLLHTSRVSKPVTCPILGLPHSLGVVSWPFRKAFNGL